MFGLLLALLSYFTSVWRNLSCSASYGADLWECRVWTSPSSIISMYPRQCVSHKCNWTFILKLEFVDHCCIADRFRRQGHASQIQCQALPTTAWATSVSGSRSLRKKKRTSSISCQALRQCQCHCSSQCCCTCCDIAAAATLTAAACEGWDEMNRHFQRHIR